MSQARRQPQAVNAKASGNEHAEKYPNVDTDAIHLANGRNDIDTFR